MRLLSGCLIVSAVFVGCHNIQVKPLDPYESAVLKRAYEAHFDEMAANAAPVETELGEIYFERGRVVLTEASRRELDAIAMQLIENQYEGRVIIEGHANDSDNHDANVRLGYQRALAAAKGLRDSGIWEERMMIKSFGATRPTETQWHSPNRVIVRIFSQGGRLEGKGAEKAAPKTLPQDRPASTGSPMMIGIPLNQ